MEKKKLPTCPILNSNHCLNFYKLWDFAIRTLVFIWGVCVHVFYIVLTILNIISYLAFLPVIIT